MTKKVLISLNELFSSMISGYEMPRTLYPARKELYDLAKEWFDAQPAISGVVYTESSDMAHEFTTLSKMQATEANSEIDKLIDGFDIAVNNLACAASNIVAEGHHVRIYDEAVREYNMAKQALKNGIKQYKGSNEPTE